MNPGAPADETAPLAGLPLGAAVGRYLILRVLGAGGMGVVYAAYDPVLDRKVALKLLHAGAGGSPEGRARLLREAQAMARLSHPGVLTVHDVGVHEEQVFVAMALVEGQTLGQWLAQQRPAAEVLPVFLQAGRGLQAAHAEGLVHRDFKPDNVLLGKGGRVYVADFGLARSAPAPDSEQSSEQEPALEPAQPPGLPGEAPAPGALAQRLTETGTLLGTPAYMAPEQYLGFPADDRTDQFSFCVALYEALYRRLPFAGDTAEALAFQAIEGKVREPPEGSVVPPWLHGVLVRGLRPRPADRYPSMEALLSELSRDPAAARRRALGVAAGAALLFLCALLAREVAQRPARQCRGAEARLGGVWDGGRPEAVRRAFLATGKPYAAGAFHEVDRVLGRYLGAWAAMHTEACEATRVRGEQSEELLDLRMQCLKQRQREVQALADLLAREAAQVLPRATQAVHALVSLEGCADGAALRAQVRPPGDPASRAQAEQVRGELARGKALRDGGQYPRGLQVAGEAVAAARRLAHPPLLAEALYQLGDLQSESGDNKAAEDTLREAVDAAIAGRHARLGAQAAARLTYVVGFQLARHREGHLWARQAQAHLHALGGDDEVRAWVLTGEGSVSLAEGRYAEALPPISEALALREKIFGPAHPAVAQCLVLLGNVYYFQGRYDEALARYRAALPVWEKVHGPEHPYVAYCLNNIGSAYLSKGQHEASIPLLSRAISIEERALGPEHVEIADPISNLARALDRRGRHDEALDLLRRALRILEKGYGREHPAVADTLGQLSQLLRGAGRDGEARSEAARGLAIAEAKLGPEHPSVAALLTELAQGHLRLGAAAKALPLLERALRLRTQRPADPAELAETRFALARALPRAEQARAVELAGLAQKAYAREPARYQREEAEVAAWLGRGRE